MREMKDSGVVWIGEIPNNWEIKRIKEKYSLQAGFTPDTKNESYYDENGYDWVTISDIEDGKTIYSTKKKISDKYVVEFAPSIIPKDSLLYSFKLSVGQTAFTGKDMYSNEAIAAFLPNDNISLSFLRYSSFLIVENAETNIYGAKILNRERIKNALVVYPPLAEQQLIATLLDQKCSQIDALISNAEKQIEKLKAYKQSLITETVTKGLNPDVPMKDSGVEWIGEIPEHFSVQNIRSLFTIKKDIIGHEPDTVLSITQNGIKIKDISENNGQMANSYAHYQIVNVGDFAMNHMDLLTGGIGISQYNGVTSPDYRVFNLKNTEMNPRYFLYIFEMYYRNKIFYAFGQGAANLGRWRLPAQNFYSIYIPVAPIEEQNEIVLYLDEKCTQIDNLISIKQQKIEKLQQYKKSVIYEYVTGKREVI